MARPKAPPPIIQPLPPLLTVQEIQSRLANIFPEAFPDRGTLVGVMAARVVFVFLYGGFVEGHGRYLRPSHVYLFTKEQAQKTSNNDRIDWLTVCNKPGYRAFGEPWYADTSREPIRDDLMRNQLLRLGIMRKRSGYAPTASTPINFLSADFAALFDPALSGDQFAAVAGAWRVHHLDKATQQRMALKAQGLQAKTGDLLIDMPDGARIRITAGPSSEITKGLIEEFSGRHLENPAVLWLSASDKKAYPQFVEICQTVGLKFNVGAELPDLILADMKEPIRFLFCEIVATDGAVTDARKQALLAIVRESSVPVKSVEFLTAFEDRGSSAFRKNFSQLAVDSLVWFRTEPDLLVILSTANRSDLDPSK
jgi:BsuBI/PstI restriction endonuclease domain/BsuBI/PstI restriction endonuclease HTH domain